MPGIECESMAEQRRSAADRIALVYAVVFVATIVLLGIAVYFAADASFRAQRDADIAKELAELSSPDDGRDVAAKIASREGAHARGAFGYALFDRHGRRVAGRMDTPRPATGFSTIVFEDPREGPDSARAKALDLRHGERLVVAVDTEVIEAIDGTILSLFGCALLVAVAIGATGAYRLRHYLRRRLDVISDTANAVVAGDLTQRVPVAERPDEFDAVAQALNLMLERIATLMDNLRQVSSDVAHDLRTPLLRLRGALEQVGQVDGAADRAIDQGDALLELFAAILRVSEIEGGGIERSFARVDLSKLVADVAESYQPALSDCNVTLRWHVQPDVIVSGNRELLAQSLANLMDNVRIHTPAGTHVAVTLTGDADDAQLAVRDTGPGVPLAERRNLARRFYRGEASRTTPGHGLGLSLVTAVLGAHRGTVAYTDEAPGLGVVMSLPRAPRSAAAAGPA